MPKTKKKSKKDPNRPKKPMTAFLLYAASRRSAIKENNPEMKVTDISKELGKEWREMAKKSKTTFIKKAGTLKNKYDKAKAKYLKEKAKHAAPKRPKSSFFLFCDDERAAVKAENDGAKITEIAKLLGALWRNLDNNKKLQYTDKAERLRATWKGKMEKWKAKQPVLGTN